MKKFFAAMALVLMALLGSAPAALAETPTEIVVEDTAGVLYLPQLRAELEKINFHDPTKVVIYTRNGLWEDNLNEETLRYARDNHPEWISADGQKWADGLFIFALDPAGRQVGTYSGEDRKLSLAKQEAVQESAKDLFREAQWTDGTIAGVKKAANLINQPWYQSAGFIVTSSITGGLALLGLGIRAGVRAKNRGKAAGHLERGDAGFSSVSLELPFTELNAKTIPAESTYGALVLEKYRTFSTRYHEAAELNQQSHAFSKKDLSKGANVSVTQEYADLAEELDTLDDVIADTNTLLNKYSGWGSAWDRQVRPLMDDLEQLPELLSQAEAQGLPTTATLGSFHAERIQGIAQLSANVQTGIITPDAALDELRNMRLELTNLLQRHSEAMIGKYAKSTSEERAMEKAMDGSRRTELRRSSPTILGSVFDWYTFYPVHSFSMGYSAGRSSVDSARSSASSSSGGSRTGYGSSGGSFSGSGSSSHF